MADGPRRQPMAFFHVPIKSSLIQCLDLTQDPEAQVRAPSFDIAEEAADV